MRDGTDSGKRVGRGIECRGATVGRTAISVKEGKDRIAHELQHLASPCGDGRDYLVEIEVETLQHLRSRELIGQYGEVSQITQQERGLKGFDLATSNSPGQNAPTRYRPDIGIH
jgi:hypothetical protein